MATSPPSARCRPSTGERVRPPTQIGVGVAGAPKPVTSCKPRLDARLYRRRSRSHPGAQHLLCPGTKEPTPSMHEAPHPIERCQHLCEFSASFPLDLALDKNLLFAFSRMTHQSQLAFVNVSKSPAWVPWRAGRDGLVGVGHSRPNPKILQSCPARLHRS